MEAIVLDEFMHRRPVESGLAEMTAATEVQRLTEWLEANAHDIHRPLPCQEYLLNNSRLALEAREHLKANLPNNAGAIPDKLFLREVLPYAQLDEPIDDFRSFFYEKLSPLVRNSTTIKEVADKVIPYAFMHLGAQKLEFKGNNTPQVMAPVTETLEKGYASCTGFSIFVADALRSVGVPARVVGTPEWNLATGGNHNWVEVWLGDGWHYIDAVPTEKVEWDNAWFTSSNTQLAESGTIHGIYTPVWVKEEADSTYNLTWRTPAKQMPSLDRTGAYKSLAKSSWDPKWEQYRAASEGLR
jgi:hypothetical protein